MFTYKFTTIIQDDNSEEWHRLKFTPYFMMSWFAWPRRTNNKSNHMG